MTLDVDSIINNLIDKTGLRLTSQRKLILKIIIENSDQHFSANDIYLKAKEKDKSIGIATIYRNIDILDKMNIIDKYNFGDDTARYDFVWKEKEKHHHLICYDCGKVMEISGLLPGDLPDRLLGEMDFQFIEHNLKIYGYCSACRITNRG